MQISLNQTQFKIRVSRGHWISVHKTALIIIHHCERYKLTRNPNVLGLKILHVMVKVQWDCKLIMIRMTVSLFSLIQIQLIIQMETYWFNKMYIINKMKNNKMIQTLIQMIKNKNLMKILKIRTCPIIQKWY